MTKRVQPGKLMPRYRQKLHAVTGHAANPENKANQPLVGRQGPIRKDPTPHLPIWLSRVVRRISRPPNLGHCRHLFGNFALELVRIRRENQLLRAAFGDAYERYRSTTWF